MAQWVVDQSAVAEVLFPPGVNLSKNQVNQSIAKGLSGIFV